jgi:hypothetical protein
MSHYHIRWAGKAEFGRERYGSRGDAEESAELLVRQGETYSVEEAPDGSCPRCCPATLRMVNGHGAVTASNLKYPWQETVADAFAEIRPEFVLWKVNVAQRTIAKRLCDQGPAHNEERVAMREALKSLKALFAGRDQP